MGHIYNFMISREIAKEFALACYDTIVAHISQKENDKHCESENLNQAKPCDEDTLCEHRLSS